MTGKRLLSRGLRRLQGKGLAKAEVSNILWFLLTARIDRFSLRNVQYLLGLIRGLQERVQPLSCEESPRVYKH